MFIMTRSSPYALRAVIEESVKYSTYSNYSTPSSRYLQWFVTLLYQLYIYLFYHPSKVLEELLLLRCDILVALVHVRVLVEVLEVLITS